MPRGHGHGTYLPASPPLSGWSAGAGSKGKGPHPGWGGRHQTCHFPPRDLCEFRAEGGFTTHVRLLAEQGTRNPRVLAGGSEFDKVPGRLRAGTCGTLAQEQAPLGQR